MTASAPVETEALISPEQYREILEGLSLESINLVECHAEIDHGLLQEESSSASPVRVGMDQEIARWEQKGDVLLFYHRYRLRGRARRKHVLRIEAAYLVRYKTEQPVSAEFVQVFQQSTLILTTYPYFRELVDSTTRRMGVPPITLPMVFVR